MSAEPELTIVIVNYNAGEYLSTCIEAIRSQTYRDYRVIVIDNASRDDSLAQIAHQPDLMVIENKQNIGFAAAQNQGMRLATGRYMMALNFDILMTPTFLEELIKAIDSFPDIGAVSGKLLRMTPAGKSTNEIDNTGLLLSRRRFPVHRGGDEIDDGQYGESDLVFGVMGAAALYRREMLEDIAYKGQYFDESYFMWYEDIDLDWRARLRGWKCCYIPNAVAYHVGDPHGHGRSKFGSQTSMRNRWRMILTNESKRDLWRNAPWLLLEEFALLRHVIWNGLLREYVVAGRSLAESLPEVMAKRRWVQSRKVYERLPDYPQAFDKVNYGA